VRINCRFDYYSLEDLIEIVRQRANALKWNYESDEVLKIIAQRAKKTPRLALNTNLQMCRNVTRSYDRNIITLTDVYKAFNYLQIDELGLDKLDRSYLKILLKSGRAHLGVISSKLALPSLTIQRVVEPYLFKEGLITKDRSSLRLITREGMEHIEKTDM
jgi:Holliday junction DNA helicase RuvB